MKENRVGLVAPMADGKFMAVRYSGYSVMGFDEAMARVVTSSKSTSGKSVESGEF